MGERTSVMGGGAPPSPTHRPPHDPSPIPITSNPSRIGHHVTSPSRQLLLILMVAACAPGGRTAPLASRSYRGHTNERDISAFVGAYPATVGTRLDDCQTCHRGGTFTDARSGRAVTKNPCDYCHLTQHPVTGFMEPLPADMRATLNPYGLAYLARGRGVTALRALDGEDSDGDGTANGTEVAALRYPGDPSSRPARRRCRCASSPRPSCARCRLGPISSS